jgi:ATP-dependent Clp protease adapter protein ClpS
MMPMTDKVFLLAPAQSPWVLEALAPLGFDPVASPIADSAGDHWAFCFDRAAYAGRLLAESGEPRGGGPWEVTLHNDDITPFDFVTRNLKRVLDLSWELAACYAMLIHFRGSATIRRFRTERSARQLIERIERIARYDNFPLRATYARR